MKSRRILSLSLYLSIYLLFTVSVSGQDRKYTGYADTDSSGFQGIKAEIEYQTPTKIGWQTNAWIGIDDASNWRWLQIGWACEKKPQVQNATYAEVHRGVDSHNLYYQPVIMSNAEYEIVKTSVRAYWKVAETTIHSESWSGIVGDSKMKNAQYMVEVFDEDKDYVPGSSSDKNVYDKIRTSANGSTYSYAPMSIKILTDTYGGLEKTNSEGNSVMKVWDTRNILADQPPTSSDQEYTEPYPPVSWSPSDIKPEAGEVKLVREFLYSNLVSREFMNCKLIVEKGLFGDSHSYAGVSRKELIKVELAGQSGRKNWENLVYYIDPEGPKLVVAHSSFNRKNKWVKRDFPHIDWVKEVNRAGFGVSDDTEVVPKRKASEVLDEVKKRVNLPLHLRGMVILRYRRLKPAEYGPEGLTPDLQLKFKNYWLAEIVGCNIHDVVHKNGKKLGSLTTLLLIIDDESGKMVRGIAMH